MRKVILSFMLIGLMIGGMFQNVQAKGKTLELNLNVGFRTEDFFQDTFYTLGAGLDFHPLKNLMISSELQLWSYSFIFDEFLIAPSSTLNLKWKSLFIGGGVFVPIILGGGTGESGILIPKFNVGFKGYSIKLTFYLITAPDDYNLLGASIGIVF